MRALDALAAWTIRCMASAEGDRIARIWLAVLRPVSRGYGALMSLRTLCFAVGLSSVRRLPVPVVSVGNLIAGGTGKTPFVEMVARRLHGQGHRVAILLRGYRGRSTEPVIVGDGRDLFYKPPLAADEAYLLARHLPGVAVLTGADRYRTGEMACEQLKCGIIVLDDGFQHLRLHRDLDIVLVDALNPLGYGRLLPSGLLREQPQALSRAHLVVITHADGARDLDAIKRLIRRYAPTAPIALAAHRPQGLLRFDDEESTTMEQIRGQRVLAFSGIANPRAFEVTLSQLGGVVVAHHTFPDHHVYSAADLGGLSRAARHAGAAFLVTTEKDMVKLTQFEQPKEGPPLLAVSISLDLLGGAEALNRLLAELVRSGAS